MKCSAIKHKLKFIPGLEVIETEYHLKGFCLDVKVVPEQLTAVVSKLDSEDFFIESITGVDWLGEKASLSKVDAAKVSIDAESGTNTEQSGLPEVAATETIDDLEAVYDFNHFDTLCRVVIRVRVPRNHPEIPTISDIYPGANWHERETHDFFGIRFIGHPNLIPLLLPEDADYHPLLKDFKP